MWIRIRIPNTDPDPESSGIRIQYGSGSTTLVLTAHTDVKIVQILKTKVQKVFKVTVTQKNNYNRREGDKSTSYFLKNYRTCCRKMLMTTVFNPATLLTLRKLHPLLPATSGGVLAVSMTAGDDDDVGDGGDISISSTRPPPEPSRGGAKGELCD